MRLDLSSGSGKCHLWARLGPRTPSRACGRLILTTVIELQDQRLFRNVCFPWPSIFARALFAVCAAVSERHLETEVPEPPGRKAQIGTKNTSGGKHTETGFDGTITPTTESPLARDRPPPGANGASRPRRYPPTSQEDAIDVSRNTILPENHGGDAAHMEETWLVTSKEDTGHRRFVTERRARRERPSYTEDSLIVDDHAAALLLPIAVLRRDSLLRLHRASKPGETHCPRRWFLLRDSTDAPDEYPIPIRAAHPKTESLLVACFGLLPKAVPHIEKGYDSGQVYWRPAHVPRAVMPLGPSTSTGRPARSPLAGPPHCVVFSPI